MKCIRFSLFLFLALAGASQLVAQVTFTAKASQKVIGQEDMLEVEFVLSGVSEVDQFAAPAFTPFTVVQGPSYTSGFNLINGNASSYYSVSYYLKPGGTGKFTFGPASVQVNGQSVKSGTISVEVVKGSTGASAAPPGNPFQGMMGPMNMDPFSSSREAYGDQVLRKGEKAEDKIRKNMILKMNVNKNSCYVGEPLIATCKLYSRLESESKVAERPSFSGFSVFDMVQPQAGSITRETLGGRPYNGILVRKAQLYPLQSGDLTIEPVELDNTVTFFRQGKSTRTAAPGGSVLDQMMKDFWGDETAGTPERHSLSLTTSPITIHVKPLPDAGKPADFTGAVGQFTLQSNLVNTSPRANEVDTLVLVLSGSGNIPMVNAPSLHLPGGLDAYDPSSKEQVDASTSPLRGRKVFSYTFTADREGNYTIPGLSFAYFDPQSATYKTLSTEPLLLKVLPGKGGSKRAPGSNNLPSAWSAYGKWLVPSAALVIAGLVVIGLMRQREKRRRETSAPAEPQKPTEVTTPVAPDPSQAYAPTALRQEWDARSRQMPTAALATFEEKDWLEEARSRLRSSSDSAAYYRSLNVGVWGLLQARLALKGERSKTLVLDKLAQKGFSPHVCEEVRQLLEECELALYAPVHTGQDMQRAMDMAERLRKRFEHDLRD